MDKGLPQGPNKAADEPCERGAPLISNQIIVIRGSGTALCAKTCAMLHSMLRKQIKPVTVFTWPTMPS